MSGISNTQTYLRTGRDDFFHGGRSGRSRKEGENSKSIRDFLGKEEDADDKMDIIRKRKEEIVDKVRRGETETSIPIGAGSYTMKQWNKMMRGLDKAIDDMQERIRKDEEKAREKRNDPVTADMLEELLGVNVKKEKSITKGDLYYQITGKERFGQDNSLYSVQNNGDGQFLITDKTTGCIYKFAENGCQLQTDQGTGRTFLIPCDDFGMSGSIMVVDDTLKAMLAQYFGTDRLEEGELTGYIFRRNEATGIEIMIPEGMEGKMAHMLFQSKADVEAYEQLVQTYKTQYPNLVRSDEMAAFYASIEIEGLCHRTATGILYTNAQGVSYADENDPEKSWSFIFDEQSEENYRMIMDMMEEIVRNGKDVRELREWEKRMAEKGKAVPV